MLQDPVTLTPEAELVTYILVRQDLDMPPGKMAAQASHAAAQSLIQLLLKTPEYLNVFAHGYSGTRIVLQAPSERDLHGAHRKAIVAGLPCALFEDHTHVLLPHFTGAPIVTALAIGPAKRSDMQAITRRFATL